MAEVPRDPVQILNAGAASARSVAAELDRLLRDLERSKVTGSLSEDARQEGLALLSAAREALAALPDLMSPDAKTESSVT
jgi:hypothetical protein